MQTEDPVRRSLWPPLLIFVFVCLAAYVDFTAYQRAVFTMQPHSLELKAQRSDDAIVLDWNPAAPGFDKASRAELMIDDGAHRTQLLLSSAQIASAGLSYVPFTSNVAFRMNVYAPRRPPVFETIRALAAPQGEADRMLHSPAGPEPGAITIRGLVPPARSF